MSISSEITRLSGNVAAALTAIGAKGVTIPSGANSDDLATLIAQIEGGGGDEPTYETVIPLQTFNCNIGLSNNAYGAYITSYSEVPIAGEKYRVTFDGTEYTVTAQIYGSTSPYIGDIGVETQAADATLAYPFEIMYYNGSVLYLAVKGSGSHSLQVDKITSEGGGGGSATLITKNITANGTYSASDDSADGYSEVTVNVPSGGTSKNVQTAQTTDRRNNTALGSVASLTCSTAGTYDVYWACSRSSTSGTWGSQLYINGTAYGTENTTWNNNVQTNHLTGVTIPANATVAVYGRSRSGYYIYVPQLTIEQTA